MATTETTHKISTWFVVPPPIYIGRDTSVCDAHIVVPFTDDAAVPEQATAVLIPRVVIFDALVLDVAQDALVEDDRGSGSENLGTVAALVRVVTVVVARIIVTVLDPSVLPSLLVLRPVQLT